MENRLCKKMLIFWEIKILSPLMKARRNDPYMMRVLWESFPSCGENFESKLREKCFCQQCADNFLNTNAIGCFDYSGFNANCTAIPECMEHLEFKCFCKECEEDIYAHGYCTSDFQSDLAGFIDDELSHEDTWGRMTWELILDPNVTYTCDSCSKLI